MKNADLKPSTYIDSSKKTNNEDAKFEIGHIVRISKDKNVFAKGYVPNWSEEVFVIKKVRSTVSWTYVMGNCSNVLRKRIAKKQIKKSLVLKK